jgi:hypothetical protein
MRVGVLLVTAVALAGCAGIGPSTPSGTTFIRADGQSVSKEQVDADQSSCSSSASEKSYQCMLAKGYFLVAVRDADTKQAQFAQITEDRRKREEARIAEEARKQEALNRAARRQAKKKTKSPDRTIN